MKEKVIKFRAWCESIKKLCNVRAIDFENEKVHIEIKNDFGCYAIGVKSDEVILEQYTSKRDSKENGMWVGDIVKLTKYTDEHFGEVIYREDIMSFAIKTKTAIYTDYELRVHDFFIEIIGNIHENGDLLG